MLAASGRGRGSGTGSDSGAGAEAAASAGRSFPVRKNGWLAYIPLAHLVAGTPLR